MSLYPYATDPREDDWPEEFPEDEPREEVMPDAGISFLAPGRPEHQSDNRVTVPILE